MNWNVRIGINPISWMNDDLPELGGDTLLETALAEGKEIGYAGFELGNKFPKDGPGLQAKLAEFDLACVSGWYSGFLAEDTVEAEIARCQAHMAKLKYNGARVVVYGECAGTIQGQIDTPLAQRPQFADQAQWQAYARKLDAFGEHLQQTYGIALSYHHHMGAFVESPQDIDQLMSLTNPLHVGLLFDTGHAWFGGAGDPLPMLRKHMARINHVHCKDVRAPVVAQARNDGWSFLTSVLYGAFTVPGDGVIDFKAVLGALHAGHYTGWLVVEAEQDPAVAPSYQYASLGYATLRGIVEEIEAQIEAQVETQEEK